jgi:hypothetical protein
MKKKITGRANKPKDTKFSTQKQTVFHAFSQHPKTMLMVSLETGILRANVCRFIAKWQKQNRIKLMYKKLCPITKNRAGFYYTGKEGENGK